MTITLDAALWVPVAHPAAVPLERGVAVLLPDARQLAVFRTHDGALHAVSNLDPVGGAAVMARGIVGDRAGEPTVASPMYKEVYSLRTGRCLDDPSLALDIHAVRVRAGTVEVAAGPLPEQPR